MSIRDQIAEMPNARLDDIITGRERFGSSPEEQLEAWNAAIDEETERLSR